MAAAADISLATFQRHLKAGRISALPEGGFDRDAVLASLAAGTDPTKNRGTRPARILEEDSAENVGAAAGYDEVRRKLDAGEPMDFMEARTANEILKAKHAALKLDEAEGLLVPAAEVRALRDAEYQALRDRVRSVPASIAESLLDAVAKGAKSPEIATTLLHEIDVALADIAGAEISIVA